MTREYRRYTDTEKAEARGVYLALGPGQAALQTGIPSRTILRWLKEPASSAVVAAAEATIAERLASAHDLALARAYSALNDPKTKPADLIRFVEVLGEQRALAEGRATANNMNLNVNADASPFDELSWDQRSFVAAAIDSYEAKEEEKRRFQELDPEALAALAKTADEIEAMSEAELEQAGPNMLRTMIGWLERSR